MKHRALVVIGTLDHLGGAERQAMYLAEHLASLPEYEVSVLTFCDGQALRPTLDRIGLPVHVFRYNYRWPRLKRSVALARLALHVRRLRVHALLPFVGVHSKTMALVWPLTGARFCWWNQQDEGRDLGGTEAERRILRRVSCITSNSVAGRDFISQTYGIDPQSISVYNNGTPLPILTPLNGRLRDELGLANKPIVSMVANLTKFKDHDTLLRAWAILLRKVESPRPILLLAGHLKEKATVVKLKTKAFDLGLSSDDVRFLGPVSDVQGLMLSSDVVVHSSLTEGCPNAVCEAMALARQVVATDIPGCRQALGEGNSEWLVEPRNAEMLADRLMAALANGILRNTVGSANRRRIQSAFSIDEMNRFFVGQIEAELKNRTPDERRPDIQTHRGIR